MKVETCWSPCLWTNNTKTACKAIAFYTVAMSVVLITLIAYQMCGGDSTQLYNPLFEADVRHSLQVVGAFLIYYFVVLIICAFMVIHGLRRGVRGWLLPWLITWFIVCIFQMAWGLWMLGGYYIYLDSVFATLCNWLWMGYNIYCWLVVYTMYKVIEESQSPNIELLWP